MALTPHFTLAEMERTATGLPNVAPPVAIHALEALAAFVLEPLRRDVGALRVTSGYRSPAVNAAVGGSRTSQHLRGEAADVVPLAVPRAVLWGRIVARLGTLPIDQAILYEDAPHVHVSTTSRYPNRGQALVHTADGRYVPWVSYRGILRPVVP